MKSRGPGAASGAGETFALEASLSERARDTLTLTGPFLFKATGDLGATGFTVATWSAKGFGARLAGSGHSRT